MMDNVIIVTLEYDYEGCEILYVFRGDVDIGKIKDHIQKQWSSNKLVWSEYTASMYNNKNQLINGQNIQINRLAFDEIDKNNEQ